MKTNLLANAGIISFIESLLQNSCVILFLNTQLKSFKVEVSCIFGCLITVVFNSFKLILNCSNLTTSLSLLDCLLVITSPLIKKSSLSLMIPFSARTVVELVFDIFEENFLNFFQCHEEK